MVRAKYIYISSSGTLVKVDNNTANNPDQSERTPTAKKNPTICTTQQPWKMHMLHRLTNWCLPVKHKKIDKKIEQPFAWRHNARIADRCGRFRTPHLRLVPHTAVRAVCRHTLRDIGGREGLLAYGLAGGTVHQPHKACVPLLVGSVCARYCCCVDLWSGCVAA